MSTTGIMPTTMAMLMRTCTANIVEIPAARTCAKRSVQSWAMWNPRLMTEK